MYVKLTCVANPIIDGILSKAIARMMIVVRTAVSSTRAARSGRAHLTFFFFGPLFRRGPPLESNFSFAASKLDTLMTIEALATDIAAKRFCLVGGNLKTLAESSTNTAPRQNCSYLRKKETKWFVIVLS